MCKRTPPCGMPGCDKAHTYTVADPAAPAIDTGAMWRRGAGITVARRLRERADEIQRDSLAVSAVNELRDMADELEGGEVG